MLRKICEKYTELTSEDIKILENIAADLPYFSQLTGADIFIDCFMKDLEEGIVVAHSRPGDGSQYSADITGDFVLPCNEPIVFFTRKTGTPIRDAKALSQEHKIVMQKTVPIRNPVGNIIAVLIEESDVTGSVDKNRKIAEMSRTTKKLTESYLGIDENGKDPEVVAKSVMMHEMHHRIKNNLQMISSILSMQERRSSLSETKEVLREDINRINSIASIYEILLNTGEKEVDACELLKKLAGNMKTYAVTEEKNIDIEVSGDSIMLSPEKAVSVVLVVNELVTNSIQHGYPNKTSGKITVFLSAGSMFSTVIVSDDGIGFDNNTEEKAMSDSGIEKRKGLGLALIKMIVKDDLKGDLSISSGREGTTVSFDLR